MTKEEVLKSKAKSIFILENDGLTPMGNPPGVSVVDKDIQEGSHSSKLIGYVWATFILLCFDILFLVIGTIRSRNLRSLGTLGIYNYNMLLHKPSLFMKNILNKVKLTKPKHVEFRS